MHSHIVCNELMMQVEQEKMHKKNPTILADFYVDHMEHG